MFIAFMTRGDHQSDERTAKEEKSRERSCAEGRRYTGKEGSGGALRLGSERCTYSVIYSVIFNKYNEAEAWRDGQYMGWGARERLRIDCEGCAARGMNE